MRLTIGVLLFCGACGGIPLTPKGQAIEEAFGVSLEAQTLVDLVAAEYECSASAIVTELTHAEAARILTAPSYQQSIGVVACDRELAYMFDGHEWIDVTQVNARALREMQASPLVEAPQTVESDIGLPSVPPATKPQPSGAPKTQKISRKDD